MFDTRFCKFLAVAIATTVFAAAPLHAGLEDGLVNYWPFDGTLSDIAGSIGGSASSVADNGSFDGANGTDGINYGPGLFGSGGLEQDGAGGAQQNNGYVRVPRSDDTLFGANATNASAPNTVSTSLWVQAAGFDTGWQTVLSHGEGAQYRIARRGGGNVMAYAGGSGDIPNPESGPDVSAGTGWHHVVAISDGAAGSTQIWVDGGLVATGAAPTIDDARGGGALDLFIGANPDTGAQNREWWGEIDDVAQWNRAITEGEVVDIYQRGLAGSPLIVPEPSAVSLCLLAILGLVARRRRR